MRLRLLGWGLAAVLLAGSQAGCESAPELPPTPTAGSSVPPAAVTTTSPTPVSFSPQPKLFDHGAVAQGVRQVLTQSFEVTDLGAVICPPAQPVRAGHTFDCQAQIGAEQRTVPITVKTDEGEYEVGAPG
ncbi:DUF4333 domain-containing protein [Amycolatopsis sp. 195334CR]|uniref:DUF4333 domain-containing protein n=1 Tax=Amycolatopsis sp. 195334CR TaxID=2814588 RepID=UPI001A8CB0A5|nr:DUF4333 domain-containing protein [Amycolatopsis sp. 195334CR]MBN6039442.1 DUF4333 domain-containing protein [Amycolatopsis sp. 195334CR]